MSTSANNSTFDSLCNDEFEIIYHDEDSTINRNDGNRQIEPNWSLPQSICLQSLSIPMPSFNVPSLAKSDENATLQKESDDVSSEVETNSFNSQQSGTVINDEQDVTSLKKSLQVNAENKNLLEKSVEYVELLKKQIHKNAAEKECMKIDAENLQKQINELTNTIYSNEEKHRMELAEYKLKIDKLREELAISQQTIDIYRQNAEKLTNTQYKDEKTVVDRLLEENKQLREMLDRQYAEGLQENENSFSSVVDEMERSLTVTEEQLKLARDELQSRKNEIDNLNEVIRILRLPSI